MPSADLILNIKQIQGYPPATSAIASDAILIQRGGLGGPYLSIDAADFVATALATPGSAMAIGGPLSVQSVTGGSGLFSNATINLLNAPTACITNLTASTGEFTNLTVSGLLSSPSAQLGTLSVAGDMQVNGIANMASAVVQTNLTAGYATVVQTLDAANLNVSNLANVCNLVVAGAASVGGYPVVTIGNAQGLAPINSPVFTGTPTAPTPPIGPTPPTDNSSTIATTAFVVGVTNQLAAQVGAQYAPLASPNFSGVPAGPTAAPGNSTAQLATTAFVQAAITASTAGVSSFNTRTGAVILTSADLSAAGGALLSSPAFTGTPSAPTATTGNASGILATTQFVQNALAALNIGVSSFNTRTGAITLTPADITGAGGALAASAGVSSFNGRSGAITLTANDVEAAGALANPSPALSGVPTAPTAAAATNTGQIATTAFVTAAVAAAAGGVISFNGRAGAVLLTLADVTGVNGAPIDSPSFSGVPQAPSAAPATNTNQIATCAWVLAELGGASIGVASFNGRGGAVVLTSADITGAGGLVAGGAVTSFNGRAGAISLTANDVSAAGALVNPSPALTGAPTAPTAAPSTNSTQLATTAFVAVATSVVISVQSFTAVGGATYTPPAGLIYAIVECIGGGAGGAPCAGAAGLYGGAGGGGSGGYARSYLSAAQIGASQPVTVGAGGTATATAAGVGGTSSFGSPALVSASGGQTGTALTTAQLGVAGQAGNGTVGQFTRWGGAGGTGFATAGNALSLGGFGGQVWGGYAANSPATVNNGVVGQAGRPNSGAGGTGASTANFAANTAGGAGGSGIVVVTEFSRS